MQAVYKSIFRRDLALLGVFTAAMWLVMCYVFMQVVQIAPDLLAKVIVTGAGIALLAFATSAMFAVYLQLRRNGDELYQEEMAGRHQE